MPITLRATVKTVTFHNPENGWSVLKLLRPGTDAPFAAVGNLPRVAPGETLELTGEWIRHATYGEQFRVDACKPVAPEGREALERYLGGGALKGVGAATAKRLVDAFGDAVFEVLDNAPHRLDEIPGLRGKRKAELLRAWDEGKGEREVLYFLQAHQLTLGLSRRLVKHYGPRAAELLKQNPYRLADEIWGIGFLKADEVARKLGFPEDGYERIRAGLAHALSRAAEAGHMFLPARELVEKASELLRLEPDAVIYTLDNMAASNGPAEIVRDARGDCYLPWLYRAEEGVARRAALLRLGLRPVPPGKIAAAIAAAEREAGKDFRFSEEQRAGIATAVNEGLFLLTGGPGTGKTTTVAAILRVLDAAGLETKLAAPTGRAARRMSEVTGRRALTIHRLLQYDPATRGFVHDEKNPLECGALVVDEVSMIDTLLMYSLLRAVRAGTRVILVGDPDQLPSIGAGKVLAEFIRSGAIPHLHLSAIFRQAEASRIVTGAHRVNRGVAPAFAPEEERDADFRLVERGGPEAVLDAVVKTVCEELPGLGLDPVRDVQVLTPMNQGPLGTIALNAALQARLNPHGPGLPHRGRLFRPGDKVMQLKNNYEKDVFNGDIGRVLSVRTGAASGEGAETALVADFDGERKHYLPDELDQLGLAYAATVHKSQGSEFRAVVLALAKSHFVMLQRNLFYTAITRARERLVLVGQRAAVHRCVEHNPAVERYTRLAERLRER